MFRPRGIGKVLDAAAPDGEWWEAGKAVYDDGGSLKEILNAAAPNGGFWLAGRKVAWLHIMVQLGIAAVIVMILASVVGSILSMFVDPFYWPLMYFIGVVAAAVVGWLVSRKIVDKIYD